MPASLRSLAIDLRVLRGEATEQHVDTLNGLYANDYLFMPWLLDDIFDVSEEVRLIIGQAWLLLMIAYVMLDQIVDRDMPAIPVIPLVQQHLLLKVSEVFGRQFESPGAFWDQYYACLYELVGALALESDCLDAHAQPYTYETMRQVCAGKAAPFRLAAYALALSSGNMQPLAVLNPALDNLLLADQLNDDALDCGKDYQAGRYTLPVLLALEVEGDSLEAASALSPDELHARIKRYGIVVHMTEQAVSVLEDVRTSLSGAGLGTTKLYTFFGKRIERVQRYQRYHRAIYLLGGMASLLTKH
jgi:hypothetical protein